MLEFSNSAKIALKLVVFALFTTWHVWAQSKVPVVASPSFEVASIKRNKSGRQTVDFNIEPGGRFVANGVTIGLLFQIAYNVKEFQITGEPSWFDNERYDVEAKPDQSFSTSVASLSAGEASQQVTKMLQSLLVERCKLVIEHESKDHSAYALVVLKNSPKLKLSTLRHPDKLESTPVLEKDGTPPLGGIWVRGRGYLTSTGADMSALADSLSRFVASTVVDKTGLKGSYDFTLQWTPSDGENGLAPRTYAEGDAGPAPDPSGPSLFSALQEQLGLRLEKQKTAVDLLVIKHAERPSEN